MESKTLLIRIGDFFFKYRNGLFPAVLAALFLSVPPVTVIGGSADAAYALRVVSVLLVLLGLALRAAVIGFKYIKRGGMNKKVYAENLVTDGFFAVCRNPLYVGNLMIYGGVVLMHGAPLVVLLGLGFFLFVYTAIVAAEEYFLRTHFAEGYAAYCADVPRWRMRFSRLKAATEGMEFNAMRVVVKDYSTIANAIISLGVVDLIRQYHSDRPLGWEMFAALVGVTLLAALAIRVAKKSGAIVAN